jgi:hypothetical protein
MRRFLEAPLVVLGCDLVQKIPTTVDHEKVRNKINRLGC